MRDEAPYAPRTQRQWFRSAIPREQVLVCKAAFLDDNEDETTRKVPGLNISERGMRVRIRSFWKAPKVGDRLQISAAYPEGSFNLTGRIRNVRWWILWSDAGIEFLEEDNSPEQLEALAACLVYYGQHADPSDLREAALEAFRLEIQGD